MLMRHYSLWIIVAALCLLIAVPISAQDNLVQISQWADEAEASSQYGDDDWSAAQATGRPDVNACEDNVGAWASADYDGDEYLALAYEEAVIPTQVNIYQTLTPGAIVGIALFTDDEETFLYTVTDDSDECPSVLSIDIPDELPPVMGVVIFLEQDRVGYWNEIDAVELIGLGKGEKDAPSSIETGRYDEFEVFNVTAQEAQADGSSDVSSSDYDMDWGRDIQCRDGNTIQDGVELTVVQQRTGNTYRITAVGIDGFDPVLGVTLSGDYNNALCNDDDSEAATYGANLPSTGNVPASGLSSQVIFNLNTNQAFEDVSIVVAGLDGSSGEFLLIIEGMYASELDGAGDPMSLLLSPALIEADVDPTAYMISVVGSFDPLMTVVDSNYDVITDDEGASIQCDDAGNTGLCWGESATLASSYVSRSQNRQLAGGGLDAMLTIPVVPADAGSFVNYLMTSYGTTEGDYVVAFHMGIQAEE